MTGKLYVVSHPGFSGLSDETRRRIVMVDSGLTFRQPRGWLHKVSRRLIVGRLPLPRRVLGLWFARDELDKLGRVTPADSVLFFEWMNAGTLKALLRLIPRQTACHIYYCNPLRRLFGDPAKRLAALRAARIGGYKNRLL